MKNFLSVLWVVLISILFFSGISLLTKKTVLYENDEIQWKQLSKEELVIAAQHYFYFLIEDENQSIFQAYKINSQHSSNKASELHVYNVPKNKYTEDELFEKLRKAELDSMGIVFLNYTQLKDLVSNAEIVKARELVQINPNYGLMEFIEESFVVFILLAVIFLVVLLLYRYVLKRFVKNEKVSIAIDCTLLVLIIFLLFKGITPDWYASYKISALVQLGITFFGAYLLLDMFKRVPWLLKLSMDKQLVSRFFITLLVVSFFVFIGLEIARSLDLTVWEGSNYTGLAIRKRLPFGLGLGFVYALADLVYHLIQAVRTKTLK